MEFIVVVSFGAEYVVSRALTIRSVVLWPNARDQRRRAARAPLADRNLQETLALCASGVTTSVERCIALSGNSGHSLIEVELDLESTAQCLNCTLKRL